MAQKVCTRVREVGLVGAAILVLALGLASARADDDPRVAWLEGHAHAIRSLDADDSDYADLQHLKTLIGDARLVGLGEQTHGDGTTFRAKVRLVRFLHEEMGFDVLAFESGLYDCAQAWLALQDLGDAARLASTGVFKIWSMSEQARGVFDYMQERARGGRVLRLAGFDCQVTGSAVEERLLPDLERLFVRRYRPLLDAEDLESARPLLQALAYDRTELSVADRTNGTRALKKILRVLDRKPARRLLDPVERSFWRRVLEGYLALLPARFATSKRSPHVSPNVRDAQMAKNVAWLADEKYPTRKIILWAASAHIAKTARGIGGGGVERALRSMKPLGEHLATRFGDDYVTIAFGAYEGEVGRPWSKAPQPIGRAEEGTLEALTVEAGFENAYFTLHPSEGPEGAWLEGPQHARPMGTEALRARWGRHFDVYVVLHTMVPSTGLRPRARPPEERAAAEVARVEGEHHLVTMLKATWSRIRRMRAQDKFWATKVSLGSDFRDWVRRSQYPERDIRTAMEAVAAWAAAHLRTTGFLWRYEELLGLMHAELREHEEAIRRFDAAIAAMPDTRYYAACIQSRYQHIVNWCVRSMIALGRAEDAADHVVRLLETDPRYRFVFAMNLGRFFRESSWDLARFDAFLQRIDEAYTARMEKFPDRTAEAASYQRRFREDLDHARNSFRGPRGR